MNRGTLHLVFVVVGLVSNAFDDADVQIMTQTDKHLALHENTKVVPYITRRYSNNSIEEECGHLMQRVFTSLYMESNVGYISFIGIDVAGFYAVCAAHTTINTNLYNDIEFSRLVLINTPLSGIEKEPYMFSFMRNNGYETLLNDIKNTQILSPLWNLYTSASSSIGRFEKIYKICAPPSLQIRGPFIENIESKNIEWFDSCELISYDEKNEGFTPIIQSLLSKWNWNTLNSFPSSIHMDLFALVCTISKTLCYPTWSVVDPVAAEVVHRSSSSYWSQ